MSNKGAGQVLTVSAKKKITIERKKSALLLYDEEKKLLRRNKMLTYLIISYTFTLSVLYKSTA